MLIKNSLMQAVSVYLTAFIKIALGLAVVLLLVSCGGDEKPVSTADTATPAPVQSRTPGPSPRPTLASSQTAALTPTAPRTTPKTTPASTLGVQGADLRGLTISFWHPWQGKEGDVLQWIVDEFNRTNAWDIHVKVTTFDGFESLAQAVETAAVETGQAAEGLPDLLVGYQDAALRLDRGGKALVDLNAYVQDPVWGFSQEEQQDFYSAIWQQDLVTDPAAKKAGAQKRLGIPFERSALVMFYNQTWAEELGYDQPPGKPADFRTQACQAAKAYAQQANVSRDGTGGWMLAALPSTTPGHEIILQPSLVLGWMHAFGGQFLRPDGKGYQFNTQETGQALLFLKGLQRDGCAWITSSASPYDEFASRRALLYIGSTSELPAMRAAFAVAQNKDQWSVLPFPSVNSQPAALVYGPSLLIPKTMDSAQLAAWTLLQWLVYPPNQAKWAAASASLPTRLSTLGYIESAAPWDTHWAEASALLPKARTEPAEATWGSVRWMLGDALAQLLTPGFTTDQVPALLESMDKLAEEIQAQVR